MSLTSGGKIPRMKQASTEVRVTDPKTGGQKGQKVERYDLIPFDALDELARVYGTGAEKYDDDNWLKGYRWRLSVGALFRHVARWMMGESYDRETGLHHLAHAAWHCFALFVYETRKLGTDDRHPSSLVRNPNCPNSPMARVAAIEAEREARARGKKSK